MPLRLHTARNGFLFALLAALATAGLVSAATSPVIPAAASGSNTFYSPQQANGVPMLAYYNSGGPPTLSASGFSVPEVDSAGNLKITTGLVPPPTTGLTIAYTGSITSNGATAVSLVAASGSKVVYVYNLTVWNTDSSAHPCQIITSSAPTVPLYPAQSIPAKGALLLNIQDSVQTVAGDSLQFNTESAGSNKMVASVGYVQK